VWRQKELGRRSATKQTQLKVAGTVESWWYPLQRVAHADLYPWIRSCGVTASTARGATEGQGGGALSMSCMVGVTRSFFFLFANSRSQHPNGYVAVEGVVGVSTTG